MHVFAMDVGSVSGYFTDELGLDMSKVRSIGSSYKGFLFDF